MQDTHDLAAFRQGIRDFVRQRLPDDLRQTVRRGQQPTRDQLVAWHDVLAGEGLLVPHWPETWGGRGWNVQQQMVFDEEMALGDAPELNAVTFDMIGPLLIRHADPAQQQRFLPAIASGHQWWCQGYSEPNAGSDLARLATRAERDGDDYVVNGSKIWTSYAQYADWMFTLVRTDREAKPQSGISFLLIDMTSPGITVRPIVGIHGWTVFNEVFLDNVRVPVAQRVGEENQGWTLAKSLLEFERLKLARIGENKRRMARAREAGLTRSHLGRRVADEPWFRERFAALEARLIALEANAARFVARQAAGERLGAEVSMLKLRGSRLIQLWEELIVDALGPEAWPLADDWLLGTGAAAPRDALAGTASSRRFLGRGYTIAGGSSEIQHNILAKQVLGL
ncbi:acyl-CoA dehydrogenase family protein [Ottowia sp.]|uniref:acyl-CoA dehydrogenase family protein n=1 Tax=Ottowia sp. TaxID=1898956 RepID=UPI001DE79357|nr:acyl-CoA dehydrogenase family protein [Ottowia sp.]MCB2024913.1 acyl-CoA dehydrogenase family protein [Ottowia sp.]MCP5259708.1 acyl-CoA dehydrogenase family protein [Burkholderiaceae bacterium]HPK32878.1 acyl-CoA dehydrogenase family protein [Ottowia sp.]HRW73814.1 acyl-CoA dehydrogenase family protein [Ottowia sp.]